MSSGPMDDPEPNDGRSLKSPPLMRGSFSAGTPSHSRNASLRSKVSFSALRSRAVSPTAPATPTDEFAGFDVVQVKDADFELIPPSSLGNTGARGSFDSAILTPSSNPGSAKTDGSDKRAMTPTISPGASRPMSSMSNRGVQRAVSNEEKQQAETHRQRELRWIQLLAATPGGQLRKSKKARRLLLEGVPSSVRSVVWAGLADVPSRRIEGIYEKLGRRGRVPATGQIQRDLALLFPGRPDFWELTGPLATVLQAYLTMVPDITYYNGILPVSYIWRNF
jgi:hypothetical protein